MANITTLRRRLEKVNTELNLIEERWPHRPPSSHPSTLKLAADPGVPAYARKAAEAAIAPFMEEFKKGWEVTVNIVYMGGNDSVSLMEIYLQGCCFASVRFFAGDEPGIKTEAHCLRRCVELFPQLVTNASKALRQYPRKVFKSKRYKQLYQQRRKLNAEWQAMMDKVTSPDKHNVPGPYAYPYGKHSKDWPCFEGMQLGR
jgi:hypothetical protein